MIVHPIEPVYDNHSKILILGSFPSVKSRESGFFYGHPRNRFWKILAALYGEETPETVEEKKRFLLKNHIAVWDVIERCEITGSSDTSIRDVIPNDIGRILKETEIERIFVNGKTAEKYYRKYLEKKTGIKAVCLPSSSPANAAKTLDDLVREWRALMEEVAEHLQCR